MSENPRYFKTPGIIGWDSKHELWEIVCDNMLDSHYADERYLPEGCLIPQEDMTYVDLLIEMEQKDPDSEPFPNIIGINGPDCNNCPLIELCDKKQQFDYFLSDAEDVNSETFNNEAIKPTTDNFDKRAAEFLRRIALERFTAYNEHSLN